MNRKSLYFEGPQQVAIRQEKIPAIKTGEVLVRSILSAVSPGTEMLIYHHQLPQGLETDTTIAALAGEVNYPMKYGYSIVGEVVEISQSVDPGWLGKRVFAFNPHESFFVSNTDYLLPIPPDIPVEAAAFLPNMETATNLVMDGRPLLGERAAVFGQGIIGLLTTALLAQFPLSEITTCDTYPNRRQMSLSLGATKSLKPDEVQAYSHALKQGKAAHPDLIFELSGSPEALNQAVQISGYETRIIIGSWYGQKETCLNLGGEFHRNRVKLISSQVSTIASDLQGRWDKARRFELAWEQLAKIKPSQFITHRLPLEQASEAYRLLDQQPEETLQVLIEY